MEQPPFPGYGAPRQEPSRAPRPHPATLIMLALAVALSAAALAVSLLHAGPPGPRGARGPAGAQGSPGAQGPAGLNAPVLGYTCQQLFPLGSANGTETTFYWPCTNKANG